MSLVVVFGITVGNYKLMKIQNGDSNLSQMFNLVHKLLQKNYRLCAMGKYSNCRGIYACNGITIDN